MLNNSLQNNISKQCHFLFSYILLGCFVFLFLNNAVSYAGVFSKYAEDYHLQGYDQQKNGNFQTALSFYYKAAMASPQNAKYYNDIGYIYEQMGEIDRADQNYQKALEIDAHYLPAYTNLGYLYKQKNNLVKAIEYFQKRIDLGDASDIWTQKAKEELHNIYLSAPHFKKRFIQAEGQRLALEMSQQSRQKFEGEMAIANSEYTRGMTFLKANKNEQAIQAFDTSLAFSPENPKVLTARQKAIAQKRKMEITRRVDKAMQMVEQGDEYGAEQQFKEVLSIIPEPSP